jgi:predicted PurR-regulated permease PerM
MLFVATVVIALAGLGLARGFFNPLMMAILLALIFGPLYGWLARRMPTWLALVIMLIGSLVAVGGLFYLLGRGVASLNAGLTEYAGQLTTRVAELQAWAGQEGNAAAGRDWTSDLMVHFMTILLGFTAELVSTAFVTLTFLLFFIAEGRSLFQRLQRSAPADNPQILRLATFGQSVIRQFGLRAIVNAITGAGFALVLYLLGIDYAALWGILTFFLSYIPYLGIIIAGAPAVILAFAEFGLSRALLVVLALAVINLSAENILSPALMGRGLNVSPAVTIVSFMFWTWLLGGPGAFLAMPLTLLIIALLDSFVETRWLAQTMTLRKADAQPDVSAAQLAGPVG